MNDGILQTAQIPGLTKRELFAAMAMQSIIAHTELCDDDGNFCVGPDKGTSAIHNFACFSVLCADTLLAALETEKP